MATPKNLSAPPTNIDSPLRRASFSVASVDYTPTNGELITAINVTTAGLLYTQDIAGNVIGEYYNTGWNPCTAAVKIKNNGSNTVTAGVAKLDTARA